MAVLYGVGVGPGDPELLTIKAVKIIKQCEVIGIPAKDRENCTAYKIAVQAVPEIEKKEVAAVFVPMVSDREKLEQAYNAGCEKLKEKLDEGKSVAFLNLGDPSIYATYMVLHEKLVQEGYKAQLISGVPSFCAVAAALGISLGTGNESIHILPGCYDANEVKKYSGTRILMKSGGNVKKVKGSLNELKIQENAAIYAVTNCGMENQKICERIADLPEDAGYFTTIIVKEQ